MQNVEQNIEVEQRNEFGQILPERDTGSGTAPPLNSSQNTERYFHQITEPVEAAPGFITNVLISNNTTDNEDDGYEILSSRDEAAERGALFSSSGKNSKSKGNVNSKSLASV